MTKQQNSLHTGNQCFSSLAWYDLNTVTRSHNVSLNPVQTVKRCGTLISGLPSVHFIANFRVKFINNVKYLSVDLSVEVPCRIYSIFFWQFIDKLGVQLGNVVAQAYQLLDIFFIATRCFIKQDLAELNLHLNRILQSHQNRSLVTLPLWYSMNCHDVVISNKIANVFQK